MSTQRWHVYVATLGPFVKIGYSANVRSRMISLGESLPKKPSLKRTYGFSRKAYAMHAERHLHFDLRRHRLNGEWFTEKVLRKLPKTIGVPQWLIDFESHRLPAAQSEAVLEIAKEVRK